MLPNSKLEQLSHEELLTTTRRLLAEADALSSRIAAVNEISVAINETLDLDAILRVVAKQAKWLMDFEYCSICLQENDKWKLIPLFGEAESETIDLATTDNIGFVIKYKQPKLIHEGSDSPFLSSYQSQIILPLKASGALLGTINFAVEESDKYTQEDMRIGYMLSLQISSALRNAQIVEELHTTQDELKLRVDDLDTYNHMIAHDLKSPLSNILLTAQIAKATAEEEDDVPEKGLKYLSAIENSSVQMNDMIDRLLWLAKIRKFEDVLHLVNIKPILNKVKARFATILEEQNIQLEITENVPNAVGEAQWLEEIFANLLSNAIKYIGEDNPAPKITIQTDCKDNMICYEVTDNGIGIKEEDQKTLFEMFKRVDGVKAEGTGLGLSIVSRIVKRMGGEFGVRSTFGEGSTFWFTLQSGASETVDDDTEK